MLEMSSRRSACTVRTNGLGTFRASEVENSSGTLALSQPQRFFNSDLSILENAFCRSRHMANSTVRQHRRQGDTAQARRVGAAGGVPPH
jgi:hypothetical protein